MTRTTVALAAAFATLLSGCAKSPPRKPPSGKGWVRFDLTTTMPAPRGLLKRSVAVASVEIPLSADGREDERVPPSRVRVLELPQNEKASWHVTLGSEPYFSYIPLRGGTEQCRTRYRVWVDGQGLSLREVQADTVKPSRHAAPAMVTVDLAEWEGREIDLIIGTEPEPGCGNREESPGLWGSPAVYSRAAATKAPVSDRPDIILLSFDAMRADAVGPDAFGRSLTPAIDRLSSESEVWTSAFSCFNVTNPSFASIMTGNYGTRHGVLDLNTPLSGAFDTMAERLRDAGYATAGIVSAQHLADASSGLAQGFDDYFAAPVRYSAETATDLAIDWLSSHDGPRFLWLHLFDPHTPHDAPEPYATGYRPAAPSGLSPVTEWVPFRPVGGVSYRDEQLRAHEDLYKAEVAYLDRQVDRLVGFLESRDMSGEAVVVIVSDHGENGPRDRVPFRHVGLWDATTHVPLIIHRPGVTHRVHDELVQTTDLYPTILEIAGVSAPGTDGRSLLDGGTERDEVFAQHSGGEGAMVRDQRFLFSNVKGNVFLPDGEFLFDVAADPEQRTNLVNERPDLADRYRAKLRKWLQQE